MSPTQDIAKSHYFAPPMSSIPSPPINHLMFLHAPLEAPAHLAPVEPHSPPIGNGFAPNSDVSIHRKQVKVTHPDGP